MKTIKHPPSIISINDSICVGRYDAYVYKYTNITNGKWYVGWHQGMFDGTYWHSSKNKEFIKVFSGLEAVLNLEILSTGLIIDMKNLESKILTDQKVKKNQLSYNGAGSPTGNNEPVDFEKCQEVLEEIERRINNGEYQEEDLDPISMLRSLQVRAEAEEKSHILRIREGVQESGLEFVKPVVIWEGRGDEGEDIRGDGNHTILALKGSPNQNRVKTLRLPLEFSINEYSLNFSELRFISLGLNPRQVVAKRETEDEDVIKQLVLLMESGTKINPKETEYGKDYCKKLGYRGRKPASLCSRAMKVYEENVLQSQGLKVAKYDDDHSENLKKLNRRADSFKDQESIVVTGNTAYASKIFREIMENVTDPYLSNRYKVHLVCFHNKETNKKVWDSKEKIALQKLVEASLNMMAPVTIEKKGGVKVEVARKFYIHEMDHYESDIS